MKIQILNTFNCLNKNDRQFIENLVLNFYNQDQDENLAQQELIRNDFNKFFKDKNL